MHAKVVTGHEGEVQVEDWVASQHKEENESHDTVKEDNSMQYVTE